MQYAPKEMLCDARREGRKGQEGGGQVVGLRKTYHVKGHDIGKGNVTALVSLHEMLVDQDGTAAGGQTQNKGL